MSKSNIILHWAKMPLSDEELESVPEGHRIRPYLLFLDMGEYYYAFPATSKSYRSKNRYENEGVAISKAIDNKFSSVLLSEVFKLPKGNLVRNGGPISIAEETEIYKKLYANSKFVNYPKEVIDEIYSRPIKISRNDLFRFDSGLYVYLGLTRDLNNMYAFRVYSALIDGMVEASADTNKYSVDVDQIYTIPVDGKLEYVSKLYGFSCSYEEPQEWIESYEDDERISNGMTLESYNCFGNLPAGTVISYMDNGESKKMIILVNKDGKLTVLEGLCNQMYKDFVLAEYPSDFGFDYVIENTLDDSSVSNLISRRLCDNGMVIVKKNNS